MAGGLVLGSCISLRAGDAPLVVSVSRDGDACRVMVAGERFTSERLGELARRSPAHRAIVIYDKETPFKCLGAAIYTLQRVGLSKIDAVSWDGRQDR